METGDAVPGKAMGVEVVTERAKDALFVIGLSTGVFLIFIGHVMTHKVEPRTVYISEVSATAPIGKCAHGVNELWHSWEPRGSVCYIADDPIIEHSRRAYMEDNQGYQAPKGNWDFKRSETMKPDDEAYVPNAHETIRQKERMILGEIPTPPGEYARLAFTLLAVSMVAIGAAAFWLWIGLKMALWLFR